MASASDGPADDMDTEESEWTLVSGRRKLIETEIMDNLKSLSQEQLKEIVGISKKQRTDKHPADKTQPQHFTDDISSPSNKNKQTGNIYTAQQSLSSTAINHTPKHRNFSPTMQKIIGKKFINLFYINPIDINTSRLQMAELWETIRPANTDVILKTQKGFLLKTDTTKVIISNTLKNLQKNSLVAGFKETAPYINTDRTPKVPSESYSCVIASVELDIADSAIEEHLKKCSYELRFCRRIISRTTNKPTHFIRIITGHSKSYENLINNGMFYKSRHYAVYPSAPPPPAPMPCGKCLQFTHKTVDCNAPIQCRKCKGDHATFKCKSQEPVKCTSCGSEEHQAWAFQCPRRPVKPIDGVPNLPVKTLNRKSSDVSNDIKNNSRIHSPITIHDFIINTYIDKLNKPKNNDRAELLMKLRKRFISEYNIETSVTFVGNNWVYILMFDLAQENHISPTETLPGGNNGQVRLQI